MIQAQCYTNYIEVIIFSKTFATRIDQRRDSLFKEVWTLFWTWIWNTN